MLKIRSGQMLSLEHSISSESLDELSHKILVELYGANSGIKVVYDETVAIECIRSAVEVAASYGVRDYQDFCLWSYLRLVTGQQFHLLPSIREMLDEPLLHIKARVRHMAVTFMLSERRISS